MAVSSRNESLTTLLFLAASALALAAVVHTAEAVIDFNSLMVAFESCAGYVQGGQTEVPADCCTNLKSLAGLAKDSTDWQTLCFFVEPLIEYAGNTALLASLPDKCGANFHFKIDTNTDCSKVV